MPNKTRSTIYDLVAALAKIAILPDLGQMPPAAPAFVAGRAPDGDMLAVIRRLLYPRCRRDEQLSENDTAPHVAGNGRPRDADLDRTSVGEGKSGSIQVDLGGSRNVKKKKKQTKQSIDN